MTGPVAPPTVVDRLNRHADRVATFARNHHRTHGDTDGVYLYGITLAAELRQLAYDVENYMLGAQVLDHITGSGPR